MQSQTVTEHSRGDLGLSPEQIQSFDDNGYLIIENALDRETVQDLKASTDQMLNDFSLDDHPMTKFSTGEGENKHVGDDYFLSSGDKVRFFFEEDAFDNEGNLVKPKHLAINKIGHYLHELHPKFRSMSLSPRNAAISRSLGFRDPRVLQSMVICKQPEIGGAVPPHQDSSFLYTNPPSAVGFWYALEDATAKNGCLSFAPGTHKTAPIDKRFVRLGEGKGTGFAEVDGKRFPDGSKDLQKGPAADDLEYKLGEVKAGSLVIIHGNVLHKSEKNTSGKSRHIYTFHMIEGQARYDSRNWLQPPDQGFSRL